MVFFESNSLLKYISHILATFTCRITKGKSILRSPIVILRIPHDWLCTKSGRKLNFITYIASPLYFLALLWRSHSMTPCCIIRFQSHLLFFTVFSKSPENSFILLRFFVGISLSQSTSSPSTSQSSSIKSTRPTQYVLIRRAFNVCLSMLPLLLLLTPSNIFQ